jgi:transposase InsO family protein
VGPVARQQFLEQMRDRYVVAGRAARSALLDEAVAMTGYHRKALIRRFTRPPQAAPAPAAPDVWPDGGGGAAGVVAVAAGYPWAVRLKALLPVWLPRARRRLHLTPAVEAQLQQISPRQMDRLLQADKRQVRRRLYGRTKPGTLLKHQVPLRTDRWDVTTPGYTEVDLVAHSGDRADGEFEHTVNQTDVVTKWVESRAVLGKSQVHVQQALEAMRHGLPFRLLGIDSDNGSEFLNAHLVRYCKGLQVQFTRGRPYKKDDNAHIEQ